MDACPEWDSWNCEEIRVALAVGLALTVDQPPLAVGVRLPLCPHLSAHTKGSNDDGPSVPVARFLYRDEKAAETCGGQLTRAETADARRISADQIDWAARGGPAAGRRGVSLDLLPMPTA